MRFGRFAGGFALVLVLVVQRQPLLQLGRELLVASLAHRLHVHLVEFRSADRIATHCLSIYCFYFLFKYIIFFYCFLFYVLSFIFILSLIFLILHFIVSFLFINCYASQFLRLSGAQAHDPQSPVIASGAHL